MGKPKSGKERRDKRNSRQKTEKQLPAHWVPVTKKEEAENNRLVAQSLRWETNTKRTDQTISIKEMTAKQIAILVTRRNMLSPDPEVSAIAVRNLIAMESQNQKDERPEQTQSEHKHVHLHGNVSDSKLHDAADDALLHVVDLLRQKKEQK